jgi:hypothetical protein
MTIGDYSINGYLTHPKLLDGLTTSLKVKTMKEKELGHEP